jgi:hypothetical protein
MQSPKRAVLFGIYIWLIWMPVIMGLLMVLPKSFTSSMFASIPVTSLLVVLVLAYTLRYLYRVKQGTLMEGLYLGLIWAGIFMVLDIVHFMFMGPFNIFAYFITYALTYAVVPVMTMLLLRFVKFKA